MECPPNLPDLLIQSLEKLRCLASSTAEIPSTTTFKIISKQKASQHEQLGGSKSDCKPKSQPKGHHLSLRGGGKKKRKTWKKYNPGGEGGRDASKQNGKPNAKPSVEPTNEAKSKLGGQTGKQKLETADKVQRHNAQLLNREPRPSNDTRRPQYVQGLYGHSEPSLPPLSTHQELSQRSQPSPQPDQAQPQPRQEPQTNDFSYYEKLLEKPSRFIVRTSADFPHNLQGRYDDEEFYSWTFFKAQGEYPFGVPRGSLIPGIGHDNRSGAEFPANLGSAVDNYGNPVQRPPAPSRSRPASSRNLR